MTRLRSVVANISDSSLFRKNTSKSGEVVISVERTEYSVSPRVIDCGASSSTARHNAAPQSVFLSTLSNNLSGCAAVVESSSRCSGPTVGQTFLPLLLREKIVA